MAFMITKDHTAGVGDEPGTNQNARGVIGPRDTTAAEVERLAAGDGSAFRMFDDDGELYYEGRYLGDKDGVEAFESLDCFGTPNAGAVRIEYRNDLGQWEAL